MTDNLPEKSATEQELSTLNLIVSQYLDFAELQARGRKLMYMADWKTKLDAFLALNDQVMG